MSNLQDLKSLERHRPLLLAMETIGWLHMAGKAHPDFLRQHGGQKNSWNDLRLYDSLVQKWNDYFTWVSQFSNTVELPGSFETFLKDHRQSGSNKAVGLLQAAHAMASGIEKQSFPENSIKYLGQDVTHMWRSSAFGYSQRNLLHDPPSILQEGVWKQLIVKIEGLLSKLSKQAQDTSTTAEKWKDWRAEAIGPENGWLRKAFSSTLAETRLPNNDVALWDQSYVAAALFKSAVAGALLEGGNFQWDQQLKQKTRWRLLTIGMGSDHYDARAVRIGDASGTKLEISRFFDSIAKCIETELAVGATLYRDSSVMVFSFPGEKQGGSTWDDAVIQKWKTEIQEKCNGKAKKLKLETPPLVTLSEPTRSLVRITQEISRAKQILSTPLHRPWSSPENSANQSTNGHVCPVCLVRTNGSKKKDRPCETCGDRRTQRLDFWKKGKLGSDTIWISEVADANDRLALLSFSFDLDPWLNGEHLDSLRAQAVLEWWRNNPILQTEISDFDQKHPFESLVRYVENLVAQDEGKNPVMNSLNSGFNKEGSWESLYSAIVEDRAKREDVPKWGEATDREKAHCLVHQLLKKLPSAGRVHRFWRTTEAFFNELLGDFREIVSASANRKRVRRFRVKGSIDGQLKGNEVCRGKLNGEPIELLWEEDNGEFTTVSNLARVLRPEETSRELEKRINGQRGLSLTSDEDQQEKRLTNVSISELRDHRGCYHPLIPLETSPRRFRVLVPLESVSPCLRVIMDRWNTEFGRVWDRMPLRAAVIAFPRLVPYQAVIEAARNAEAELTETVNDAWRVRQCKNNHGITSLAFVRGDDRQELRTVPTALPDGRPDVFYPYVKVQDRKVRHPLDFQHPNGTVYRHVTELCPGDGVKADPARIITLFLEGTGRRFEKMSWRHLSDWTAMEETWRILCEVSPSTSALKAVWSIISDAREEWKYPDATWAAGGKEAWLAFVRATFANRTNATSGQLDALADAAESGVLEWCLEWHLSVLKRKPKVEAAARRFPSDSKTRQAAASTFNTVQS